MAGTPHQWPQHQQEVGKSDWVQDMREGQACEELVMFRCLCNNSMWPKKTCGVELQICWDVESNEIQGDYRTADSEEMACGGNVS